MRKIIFLILILFCHGKLIAGLPGDSSFIDVSGNVLEKDIAAATWYFQDNEHINIDDILKADFRPFSSFTEKNKLSNASVTSTFYFCFTLKNTSAKELRFYYYPGSVFKRISVYKKNAAGSLELMNDDAAITGFIPLKIARGEGASYIIKLNFFKLKSGKLQSVLLSEDHLEDFKAAINLPFFARNTGLGLLSGMLLLMCMFTIVNYIITKRPEFIYNSIYTACMFLLLFFAAFLTHTSGPARGLFYSYYDLLLLIIGMLGYLQFVRIFINETIRNNNMLSRFIKFEQYALALMMILYTGLHFFTETFSPQETLENVMKIFMLFAGVIYIVITFRLRNRFLNYLAAGTALQIIFSVISFIIIIQRIQGNSIFTSPSFFFGIGVIASVIFYLLGLTYRNRVSLIDRIREREVLRTESEKKEFEKQLEIITAKQNERNRISADMHDDLGAGMTTIRLYSELALSKMGDVKIPEIEKISASANDLLNKMNAIIWSMSNSNDSLANMVAYIRSYAIGYLEETSVKCNIYLPESIPDIEINGEIRRNIFLITKEALHNVVKHSNATEVELKLLLENNTAVFTIYDNGTGIDLKQENAFRNGLKNMQKRASDVKVSFKIENKNGTLITIKRQIY